MNEPVQPNLAPQAVNGIKRMVLGSLVCAVILFLTEEYHWLSHSWRAWIFAIIIGLLSGAAAPLTRASLKSAMLFGAVTTAIPGVMLLYVLWKSIEDGSGKWLDWSTLGGVALSGVFFFIAKAMFNGFRDGQKFGHLYRRD